MSATVTVLYFGTLREQRGLEREQVPVPPGTTVAALYRQLFPPGPAGALPVAYACNEAYVSADTQPADGDEVVFIPPVGGG